MAEKITSQSPVCEQPLEFFVEESEIVQGLAENLSAWNYHLKQKQELNEGEWAVKWYDGNELDTLDLEVTGFKGEFPEEFMSKEQVQEYKIYGYGAFSSMSGDREIADRPIFIAEQILEEEDRAAVAGYIMHELGEHYNHQEGDELTQQKAVRN
ncbi:MAG: hypothetical protein J07AB43_06040, partial [Candidatus Nanosalina sp. J07AB43]